MTSSFYEQIESMDYQLYDDIGLPMDDEGNLLKPIIKRRGEQSDIIKKKKKSVIFRDPICEVRLYDKAAAKRQQWGHSSKFCRVKRFCWDKEDDVDERLEELLLQRKNRWLPNETDQDYRLILWQDMQKRRLNRKRRTEDRLAYLVQGLEISPNCVEEVVSKMRKIEDKATLV